MKQIHIWHHAPIHSNGGLINEGRRLAIEYNERLKNII